jgi:hypothetical protein
VTDFHGHVDRPPKPRLECDFAPEVLADLTPRKFSLSPTLSGMFLRGSVKMVAMDKMISLGLRNFKKRHN